MRLTTFIYALTEQGTKTIRYFGKADNPTGRRKAHIRDAKNGEKWPVSCWIRKRLEIGQSPDVHVLCEVPQNDWERFERAFIALGRLQGMRLLNQTDGGDGIRSGYKHSPEFCAKLSIRMKGVGKGKKLSPERCAQISAAQKGKKISPETRAKLSVALKGKKKSPETRTKMCAAQIGKEVSPETRAKQSARQLGTKRGRKPSSNFIGVFFDKTKRVNPWRSQLLVEGKRRYPGGFSSEYEAAQAYDQASKKFHGEKAKLNFPNG